MEIIILALVLIGLLVNLLIYLSLGKNKAGTNGNSSEALLREVQKLDGIVKDEFSRNRSESNSIAKDSRTELAETLKTVSATLNENLSSMGESTRSTLGKMRETIEERLLAIQDQADKKLSNLNGSLKETLSEFKEGILSQISELSKSQKEQIEQVNKLTKLQTEESEKRIVELKKIVESRLTDLTKSSAEKLESLKSESSKSNLQTRTELQENLKSLNDTVINTISQMSNIQKKELEIYREQLSKLSESTDKKMTGLSTTVEKGLKEIQSDNSQKLEKIRTTVDEQLQTTLQKRLSDSFRLVSERLEQVHKGLGEMQSLATGVGDLNRVLSNVKSRGTWAEVQLRMLLEQVLAPEQFEANVATKGGLENVEFVIKLPGNGNNKDDIIWLPIDAKFPLEDYRRLQESQDAGDKEGIKNATQQLDRRIKGCAKDISEKYINPPKTTDFAILFLPNEGLFAEVIRRQDLIDHLQVHNRVVIAGPATLWSILNSLQMGFRTLAIQKRSSEVWKILSGVKAEWAKYGQAMDKVKKKLQEASNTVDAFSTRSRQVERKLKAVEELPATEISNVLGVETVPEDEDFAS